MKIFPASPLLLLELLEEKDTCRKETGAVWLVLCLTMAMSQGHLCKDGRSNPHEGKGPEISSHGHPLVDQIRNQLLRGLGHWPLTKHKART